MLYYFNGYTLMLDLNIFFLGSLIFKVYYEILNFFLDIGHIRFEAQSSFK
jgi:hypothetical protein